jgi:hypothetical protein
MHSFSADELSYIQRSVLCWLATASADGQPNVSPKEIFVAHGQNELLIAHIASPVSVKNIEANPKVCVSFIDVFTQRGYKVYGDASFIRPASQEFVELQRPLLAMTQGVFPILGVIRVVAAGVQPIVAPSYRLVAGTTEASQVASAMATYGVVKPNAA